MTGMTSNPPVIAMKPSCESEPANISIKMSKEWILPPRPKPGRKADTDNAPTKRKAQNREAQRAFRERRAARVGELEQQIRDMEAAHRKDLELLEVDNGRLKLENIKLKEGVDALMRELNTIRSLAKLSHSPEHAMRTPTMTPDAHGASTPGMLETRRNSLSVAAAQSASDAAFQGYPLSQEFLGQSVPLRKRRNNHSHEYGDEKRQRRKLEVVTPESPFSMGAAAFKPPAGESCGFCSDGTPCLCAEAAQQYALEERERAAADQALCAVCAQSEPCLCSTVASVAATARHGETTPTSVLLEAVNLAQEEENGLCTGNPGSCRQCRTDPMSTLFCTTLAERKVTTTTTRSTIVPDIRVESRDRPDLTHRSSTFSTSSARDSTPPLPVDEDAFVPCSTAYRALSKHENFRKSDMDSIVRGLDVDSTSGKGVQVGSVRDVLRILDRGLGRDD